MDATADVRLRRIEEMLRTLIGLYRPTIRLCEVQDMLGHKTHHATYVWLSKHGIKSVNRKYDRAKVICAATQEQ